MLMFATSTLKPAVRSGKRDMGPRKQGGVDKGSPPPPPQGAPPPPPLPLFFLF